jgi:ABC-2 type transport system permease protein
MKQEMMLLLKQRNVLVLLAISMLLTWLSLQSGWHNMAHIRTQISEAEQDAQTRRPLPEASLTKQGVVDPGEIGYYFFQNVYQAPAEWSFIALGNRLVTPYIQRIRMLGLQGQLYDGESHHPEYVMQGSFDYAFWLVFFSPLLCIALLHDLKAGEFLANRLLFLNSLIQRPWLFWAHRIVLRWLLVLLSLLIPLTVFSVIYQLSLKPWLHIVLITSLYTGLWVLICTLVASRTSAVQASRNAMLLTSLWLGLTVILPNLAQLWLHQRYPVIDGSQLALQHRQLVHSAWDLPKDDTLQPFYALYPEWKHSAPVTERFHWKWYFAFQHMADVHLQPQVTQREHMLLQRDQATARLSWLLPGLWVQRELESVACSNVPNLIVHRHAIEAFHTEIRHALYPYLFNHQVFKPAVFKSIPDFKSSTCPI